MLCAYEYWWPGGQSIELNLFDGWRMPMSMTRNGTLEFQFKVHQVHQVHQVQRGIFKLKFKLRQAKPDWCEAHDVGEVRFLKLDFRD